MSEGRLSPAKATRETDVEKVGRWMAGLFDDSVGEGPRDVA
jgi:hypothetical protein